MAEGVHIGALCAFLWINIVTLCCGQSLTPPMFNLAKGKPIHATATCGEGISKPELYCKLTGAIDETDLDIDDDEFVIQVVYPFMFKMFKTQLDQKDKTQGESKCVHFYHHYFKV